MTDFEIMAFQAIMKYGNMTKAAESLFISQPALSTRLVGLENELGCRLFLRRRGVKNIELTEKGKQFIALAERWPVGMLFVRCKGGISHHPAESVMAEDVALAIEAFGLAVRTLGAN